MGLLDAVEQLEPVELGALQPDIEDHERGTPFLDRLERLVAVLGETGRMTFVLEKARDQFPDVGFVIDDQNVRRHGSLPLPPRPRPCTRLYSMARTRPTRAQPYPRSSLPSRLSENRSAPTPPRPCRCVSAHRRASASRHAAR